MLALYDISFSPFPLFHVAYYFVEVLHEAGYGDARVATAVNGHFVPVGQRASCSIEAGDQLEIVAPRQGG